MEHIDWFKMPLRLRCLPFDERKAALEQYEREFGPYDWKKAWDDEVKG